MREKKIYDSQAEFLARSERGCPQLCQGRKVDIRGKKTRGLRPGKGTPILKGEKKTQKEGKKRSGLKEGGIVSFYEGRRISPFWGEGVSSSARTGGRSLDAKKHGIAGRPYHVKGNGAFAL